MANNWYSFNCRNMHGAYNRSNKLCNSYTMGCLPVRGDNPRALASGLSCVQVDKHGITILYHLHQCIYSVLSYKTFYLICF